MPRFSILLFLLLGAIPLHAQTSLENAAHARSLLGPAVWSKIIRIENDSRLGRYPRVVHALVFELCGVLWFYTDSDGTQSFSLHRDRVEEEKADFGPLLRDIDRGFLRWSEVTSPSPAPSRGGARLRNGCFIESVSLWRGRLPTGMPATRPRLVSYYLDTPAGRLGHTVLAYETDGQVEVIDPVCPDERRIVRSDVGASPLNLARLIAGSRVVSVRTLSLDGAVETPVVMADRGGPRGRAAGESPARS